MGGLYSEAEADKIRASQTEMECRSVVLAKQMLSSNAGDSLLKSNLTQGGDDDSTKFSLSPFRWILRTTSIGPSSIFHRLERLYSPTSFDSTTSALDPF